LIFLQCLSIVSITSWSTDTPHGRGHAAHLPSPARPRTRILRLHLEHGLGPPAPPTISVAATPDQTDLRATVAALEAQIRPAPPSRE
jgi:hypothetical protein